MPESAGLVEISSDDGDVAVLKAEGKVRRRWKSLPQSRSVKAKNATSQPGTQQLMHACCCKTFLSRRHWLKSFFLVEKQSILLGTSGGDSASPSSAASP